MRRKKKKSVLERLAIEDKSRVVTDRQILDSFPLVLCIAFSFLSLSPSCSKERSFNESREFVVCLPHHYQ